MQVRLCIRLYEFEKIDDTIYSTGLDFELGPWLTEEELKEATQFEEQKLSLRLDKRRRKLAIYLISGLKWTLISKSRNYIVFKSDISPRLWEAFTTLCKGKYRLTKKRFEEWMAMKPEELIEVFEVIELSSALGEGGYA